ncbi:hypothetical protein Rsub_03003 [Raphidocelis subcapitata]|uniref:Uncharacterized protein n=1 Tax=Raphidocelis subcapitata TaxID=307507 RepID=A0A2V0NVK1_9CHLO|nr:hypothetical protein Rsub_03003 [Raphidocelis subcapitata]|eukprot:GBF90702.1 hypothetical protein Rsub_03003 [Raphidocelis subcapitata]
MGRGCSTRRGRPLLLLLLLLLPLLAAGLSWAGPAAAAAPGPGAGHECAAAADDEAIVVLWTVTPLAPAGATGAASCVALSAAAVPLQLQPAVATPATPPNSGAAALVAPRAHHEICWPAVGSQPPAPMRIALPVKVPRERRAARRAMALSLWAEQPAGRGMRRWEAVLLLRPGASMASTATDMADASLRLSAIAPPLLAAAPVARATAAAAVAGAAAPPAFEDDDEDFFPFGGYGISTRAAPAAAAGSGGGALLRSGAAAVAARVRSAVGFEAAAGGPAGLLTLGPQLAGGAPEPPAPSPEPAGGDAPSPGAWLALSAGKAGRWTRDVAGRLRRASRIAAAAAAAAAAGAGGGAGVSGAAGLAPGGGAATGSGCDGELAEPLPPPLAEESLRPNIG